MGLLGLLLPALLPAGVDLLKQAGSGIIGLFTGAAGSQPKTVDELLKVEAAETEKLKALADIDKPASETSKWVANLRAANRYLLADLILLTTAVSLVGFMYVPSMQTEAAKWVLDVQLQLSSSVFSFMFGDRVYLSLKGKK